MKNKILEVLNSKNAMISILSILLIILNSNGVYINADAESIFSLFDGLTPSEAAALFITNFIRPFFKAIESLLKNGLDWSEVIRSNNFQVQMASILILLAGAFFDETTASMLVTGLLHLFNFTLHISKPAKYESISGDKLLSNNS